MLVNVYVWVCACADVFAKLYSVLENLYAMSFNLYIWLYLYRDVVTQYDFSSLIF